MTDPYNLGTVTVGNGDTTVTGTGTFWAGKVRKNDLFMDPAQGLFARIVADPVSNTEITINAWPGEALEDAAYEIIPVSDGIDISGRLRDLLAKMSAIEANGRGLFYRFSDQIEDADPGAGRLRLNAIDPVGATAVYIDNEDANGAAAAAEIDTWAGSTSLIKGVLWLRSVADPSSARAYALTGAVVDGTGYRKLTVEHIGGTGGFAADEALMVAFSRAGDQGDAYQTDATVDDMDGLTAYDSEAVGFRVFVRDLGGAYDNRSGVVIKAASAWDATAIYTGPTGSKGDRGDKGWSPMFAGVADGERRVEVLIGYVGGEGTPPTEHVGEYRKGDGTYTTNIAEAVDYRGPPGRNGAGTVAELVPGRGILINATDPTRPEISTDQTADETQNFYATLALEQAEDRSDGPVMAGPDGNGLFDGFNALTYVDTAAASGLDTSEAGLLKPLPLVTAMSISFTHDSPNYGGYNLRFRIPASKLSGKGDQIKLRLAGVTTGAALVLSSVYVGHKASSGNVWDFDGGQKQIKVGGNAGFSVPVNGDVETDWLDFDFDDSRDLIVAMHCTSGDLRIGTIASGGIGGSFSTKMGADEGGVSAPGGYSTSSTYDRLTCYQVQVRTSAMSVRSSALTLSAEPGWARLYFIADLQDATLNTDLLVSVSRDGDDFTALTATRLYQRPDGSGVFATDRTDLTSDPGSIGRWRIETDNATQPKILAIGVMFGVN